MEPRDKKQELCKVFYGSGVAVKTGRAGSLPVSPGGKMPGPRLFPSRTGRPVAHATPGEISRGPD